MFIFEVKSFWDCESAECLKSSYCHLWLTVSALWFVVLERCTAVQCSGFVRRNWCPCVTASVFVYVEPVSQLYLSVCLAVPVSCVF